MRFASVRRAVGAPAERRLPARRRRPRGPGAHAASLLLDQSHLTNAYAVLETSGGAGSTVTLTYAEALEGREGGEGKPQRDRRQDASRGVQDMFRPGGRRRAGASRRSGSARTATSRSDIETADEPLRIHDLHGIFTAYPFEEKARFTSDLPWIDDMWEINWRVARLCAWETYLDTPYYEQLQYVGDTRIQALISLYMSGDDRLVRQAIAHFDVSRIPEGITASRYPSDCGQYIPTFSLHLGGHGPRLLDAPRRSRLHARPLARGAGVLGLVRAPPGPERAPRPMPWWNFVDWARGWPVGIPPGRRTGTRRRSPCSSRTRCSGRRSWRRRSAAPAKAARYRALADRVRAAVRAKAWDASRGLFLRRAGSHARRASRRTRWRCWWTRCPPASSAPSWSGCSPTRRSFRPPTTSASTCSRRCARPAWPTGTSSSSRPGGRCSRSASPRPPESPEPTRSDSHAWSAHPNYGLLATVLGVRPAEPGLPVGPHRPEPRPLKRAEGRVPHPRRHRAQPERAGERGIRAEVTLPAGLDGTSVGGGEKRVGPGRQVIEI